MKFLFASIIVIILTGCASTTNYVVDSAMDESNSSVVYVYRTDVAYNSMNPEKPFFFLDEQLVGKLGTGQFVRFYVSPGLHEVSSKESFFFSPGSESGKIKGEFKAGDTYYFRYSKDFSNMYGTGVGFVMSDTSSLRPATKSSFDKKS